VTVEEYFGSSAPFYWDISMDANGYYFLGSVGAPVYVFFSQIRNSLDSGSDAWTNIQGYLIIE
jgi:hypothetical protein